MKVVFNSILPVTNRSLFIIFLTSFILFLNKFSFSQKKGVTSEEMQVGVASIDITPKTPIRLAGYAARTETETDKVLQGLSAKALVLGSDEQGPTVIITVDLVGITWRIIHQVVNFLSEKYGINPAQIAIFASHTHSGPEIGSLINILQYHGGHFTDSLLPLNHLIHIAEYTESLTKKLERVASEALKNRKPAYVSWGQGQVFFAKNRNPLTIGAPVDVSLPILKIINPDGSLRAVFVNYACHGTTLTGNFDVIDGDWIGEAEHIIETRYPGATALIALGCAGDSDPYPRGSLKDLRLHGEEIADNVDKLLTVQLQPLNAPPTGEMKWVELPLKNVPGVSELIQIAQNRNSVEGYEARLNLEAVERGKKLSQTIDYPIQIWNFDNKMAMLNLGGEVVVDYSKIFKNKFGAEHLWINAYANDIQCYIPSKRILKEGVYEAVGSIYWYNHPTTFDPKVQDIIVHTVDDLMPGIFKATRPKLNQQELIHETKNGIYHLSSWLAGTPGNQVNYIPDWRAFYHFSTQDQAIWKVNIKKSGKYTVYIKYAIPHHEAGKDFVLIANKKQLKGKTIGTPSWFTYKIQELGSVSLKSGIQKFILKSFDNKGTDTIFNLRGVFIVPKGYQSYPFVSSPFKAKQILNTSYSYWDNPNYLPRIRLFAQDTSQKDIVMLGNSLTEREDWAKFLGSVVHVANRGIGSDVTAGYINRLNYVFNLKPKICFIEGGVNDLVRHIPQDTIIKHLSILIDTLRTRKIIPVLTTASLVGKNYKYLPPKRFNKQIRELDFAIGRLAKSENVKVIDLNPLITNGKILLSKYADSDGIHYTSSAYAIWKTKIEKILNQVGIER